jgi:hypothetical protein
VGEGRRVGVVGGQGERYVEWIENFTEVENLELL